MYRNNLTTKIALFNVAVTGSISKENVLSNAYLRKMKNINLDNSDSFKRTTLDKIVKEYDIKEGSLKIDCEGAEYEIILSSQFDVLRKFTHIQMEYHYGFKILKKYLKLAGFSVKVSGNRYFATPNGHTLMQCGDLYATREHSLQ